MVKKFASQSLHLWMLLSYFCCKTVVRYEMFLNFHLTLLFFNVKTDAGFRFLLL